MNIVIVDDHPLFRHALIQAVRYNFPQVRITEISTADDLYTFLEQHDEPDLILLDLNLPGASGFSTLVHIRSSYPILPVIIVSAHEEVKVIQRAMTHGAMGYIPKSAHPSQIGEAIQQVLEGDMWLPQQMAGQELTQEQDDSDIVEKIQSLTQQQFRVLMMLSEGLLNKQISYTLGLSEATIKAHVTAIYKKLGVQNRTQAVLMIKALKIENKNPL